ncbi:hypothetical protein F3N42_01655 [Marinihelvus fidelis]|uniref:Uncharacterized protein n=1 Tax=Marinihelvus fidelis TaxID=2613842 RepID=A0A5N0TDD8_9GAMM|nr:hypothetical protein [Marinihelvus fidelis]KAA9133093.1 hypothetical protein F3N42_01655 [Marinihelvus fidelis]
METDEMHGPYVQLGDFDDYDFLEDQLTERFGIDFFVSPPRDVVDSQEGYRIWFGKHQNPDSLQMLIDQIVKPNS